MWQILSAILSLSDMLPPRRVMKRKVRELRRREKERALSSRA